MLDMGWCLDFMGTCWCWSCYEVGWLVGLLISTQVLSHRFARSLLGRYCIMLEADHWLRITNYIIRFFGRFPGLVSLTCGWSSVSGSRAIDIPCSSLRHGPGRFRLVRGRIPCDKMSRCFFLPWRLEGAKLGCRYSVPSLQGPRTWLFAAIYIFFLEMGNVANRSWLETGMNWRGIRTGMNSRRVGCVRKLGKLFPRDLGTDRKKPVGHHPAGEVCRRIQQGALLQNLDCGHFWRLNLVRRGQSSISCQRLWFARYWSGSWRTYFCHFFQFD